MFVQHGQVNISSANEYLVIEPSADGGYETVYWQGLGGGSELFAKQRRGIYC